MTYSTGELRERGLSDAMVAWRCWRREMCLTQIEAAAMAGVCERALLRAELGLVRPRRKTWDKLAALMARWDESKRPARGPERRGGYQRRPKEDKADEKL